MMLTDTIELCTPIAGKEGEITCTWDQWIDCNAFKGLFYYHIPQHYWLIH